MLLKTCKFIDLITKKLGILLFDKTCNDGIQFPIRHVLIIRWDAKVGDSIVSSFFYREIKKIYGVKVSVITTEDLALLYQKHFGVDNVILIGKGTPSYYELIKISQKLAGVDTVIHTVEYMRIKDLFFISRLKPKNIFSLDDSIKCVNVKMGKETQYLLFHEKYSFILNKLGIENINEQYIIPFTVENTDNHTICCGNYDVVFNPFGSRKDKSLNIEKASLLLNLISDQKPDLLIGILSSPDTKNNAILIKVLVGKKNVFVIDNVNTIYDAIDVISKSMLVVSVDTAIVHITSGLDKKLIAIYPSKGNNFNPWLPKNSKNTRIVFSNQDTKKTREKNMNDFNEYEIVDSIHSLYE